MTSTIYFLGETIKLECAIRLTEIPIEEAVYIHPHQGSNAPPLFSRDALIDLKTYDPGAPHPVNRVPLQ